MGSTFVDFRDSGYDVNDAVLEVWLHFLVIEIDKLPKLDPWLKEVRDEWELQSTAGFNFGVMPGLDRFVTGEDQRNTILALSERALREIERHGKVITKEELNFMHLGGAGSSYGADLPTEMFLQAGEDFVKLLRGEPGSGEDDMHQRR